VKRHREPKRHVGDARLSGVYWNQVIMPGKNIAVPDEVYERVQKIATAEGTTVEELATKALERDLARRWLERVGREGQARRLDMTDDEVETIVERAVQESRGRS
jgi:predicted CopG family antitoxin